MFKDKNFIQIYNVYGDIIKSRTILFHTQMMT